MDDKLDFEAAKKVVWNRESLAISTSTLLDMLTALEGRREETFSIGQQFYSGGAYYLIVETGLPRHLLLVNTYTGKRWGVVVPVHDVYKITEQEFTEMTGSVARPSFMPQVKSAPSASSSS